MSTTAVGGIEKATVSVANMENPCLLGLDSLFQSAACDDLGRMQRQVGEKAVQMILEGTAEQVESPMTNSYVEDETGAALQRHEGR